jgi:hypothetical protein
MRHAAVVGLLGICLLLAGALSLASAASSSAKATGGWAAGTEAVLPANASASDPRVAIVSVSCASAGNCSAVGEYTETSDFYQGLLLDEVDGSWQSGVAPNLPANAAVGQDEVQLASVSCPSVGDCTAVGTYLDSSYHTEGLLLSGTGGVWAAGVEAPLPADADPNYPNVVLSSVSCASPGNCTAVGIYEAAGGRFEGLLLTESAGVWATGVKAVLPADADPDFPNVSLNAVSCSSPGNCTAVGIYNLVEGQGMSTTAKGLLLTETDGSWATGVEPVLPPSASPDYVWLNAVSCASAGNCSALGAYDDSAGSEGLLLTEKSGAWETGVKARLPAGANHQNYVLLSSVSCPSAGNCEAIGVYGTGTTVLLNKTAGKWSRGEAITSGGFSVPAVSCPSVGNCGAVSDSGALLEMAGDWSTGVAPTLPGDADGDAVLSSVSCAAMGYCSAVGRYTDTSGAQEGLLLSSTSICLVPRLRGKTLETARRSIKSHDCSVGKIKRATSRSIKRGRVISQKPKPGTQLTHGARVRLVVSKGSHT